jgi:hypothetical protein
MAGGIFFLGQAVASAEQTNTNGTGQDGSVAVDGSGDAAATNVNGNLQLNKANASTTIVSAPEQNSTATNSVNVTLPAGAPGTVKVEDVTIDQNAQSKITGGNQEIESLPTPAPAVQNNTNTTKQDASTETDNDHPWKPGGGGGNWPPNNTAALLGTPSGGGGGGDDADATNVNHNRQINLYDGSTTIISTPVQNSTASNEVNIDFSNAQFWCGDSQTDFSSSEAKKCEYYIKLEGLNITQNATSEINGGNQVIGSPAGGKEHDKKSVVCPEEKAAPAAVKPVAMTKPVTKAPVLSSAQPSAQKLAFTGSDVSLPLTVGLLALTAGIGLTAAGRRRETQTV